MDPKDFSKIISSSGGWISHGEEIANEEKIKKSIEDMIAGMSPEDLVNLLKKAEPALFSEEELPKHWELPPERAWDAYLKEKP